MSHGPTRDRPSGPPSGEPAPARVLGDRYHLETLLGFGGSGEVFRARDIVRGVTVAIKQLRAAHEARLRTRFQREAQLLERIHHPGVVRYVDHGVDADGAPFLVMEWLDGPTLAEHLRGGPLDVHAAVRLGTRLASALAEIHRAGIVHRDLTPHNVILAGGRVDDARIIDLGIARPDSAAMPTPGFIGTPAFAAPEQLESQRVDHRADLYSLGVILFTALAGRQPFTGNSLHALLFQVINGGAPRLDRLVAGLPDELVALIDELLARHPDERPRAASLVHQRLERLQQAEARAPSRSAPRFTAMTEVPLRTAIVIRGGSAAMAADLDDRAVQWERYGGELLIGQPTLPSCEEAALIGAALAWEVHGRSPDAICVVGTRRWPPGQKPGALIERALSARAGPPLVDEPTARLVDGRYDLSPDLWEPDEPTWYRLGHELSEVAHGRRRLTPLSAFVGRDHELETLVRAYEDCVAGHRARTFLVTGEAGSGKSRLARELLKRITGGDAPPRVLRAHGRVVRTEEPLAFVQSLVRSSLSVAGAEPSLHHLALPAAQAARLRYFLSVLLDREPPDGDEWSRAAAANPAQMADQLNRTVYEWLEAELDARPVLAVLDDVHWIDEASARITANALRRLARRPLLVLALARPEAREPAAPWTAVRPLHELPVPPLPDTACRTLMRELAERLPPERVERVISRSRGNPLLLEEMVRHYRDGHDDDPEEVHALIESRLMRLDSTTRLVARIAGVCGPEFSASALTAVLGEELDVAQLDQALASLEEHDLVETCGRAGWRFRHDLVPEVALRGLPADLRRLAHARAGAWMAERLARNQPRELELDPLLHGGWAGAARHYLAAGATSAPAAVDACRRAAAYAATRGALREAIRWRQQAVRTYQLLLERDAATGCELTLELAAAHLRGGDVATGESLCREVGELARGLGDGPLLARAGLTCGSVVLPGHTRSLLESLLRDALAALPADERRLRARVLARLASAQQPAAEPELPVRLAREAVTMARAIGDPQTLLRVLDDAISCMSIGVVSVEERIALHREHVALARSLELPATVLRGMLRVAFECFETGDGRGGSAAIDEATMIAAKLDDTGGRWQTYAAQAIRAARQGRADDATERIAAARRVADQTSDALAAPTLAIAAASCARALGPIGDEPTGAGWAIPAPDVVAGAPREGTPTPLGFVALLEKLFRASRLARTGHGAAARALVTDDDLAWLTSMAVTNCVDLLADVAVAAGDLHLGRTLEALLGQARHRFVAWNVLFMGVGGPVSGVLGALARLRGAHGEAIALFEEGRRAAAAADMPVEAAALAFDEADARFERREPGDVAAADQLRAGAEAEAARLGAPRLQQRADYSRLRFKP